MKYKFIINPQAGKGKTKTFIPIIKNYCQQNKIKANFYLTKGPHDATYQAQLAIKEGFDTVVAVGGDGTINEVINGIANSHIILAVIPTGTGNDFARTISIPNNLEKACNLLKTGEIKSLDLGRLNEHYFINAVGIGFDAVVVQTVNKGVKLLNGFWAYTYAVLKNLFSYQAINLHITLDQQKVKKAKILLVAVGIGQYYGGGMKILPDAKADDGFFDICIIEDLPWYKILYHFPKILTGKHKKINNVSFYKAQKVKIKINDKKAYQMEGEVFSADFLDFSIIKKGIKVITGY